VNETLKRAIIQALKLCRIQQQFLYHLMDSQQALSALMEKRTPDLLKEYDSLYANENASTEPRSRQVLAEIDALLRELEGPVN
jgi:hypothetical protein